MNDSFALVPIEVLSADLKPNEFRVLVGLYSFRGKNTNTVWPGLEKLAVRCGIKDPTTVSKITTALAEKGWLKKKKRGFTGGNQYKLTIPQTVNESSNLDDSSNLEELTNQHPANPAISVTKSSNLENSSKLVKPPNSNLEKTSKSNLEESSKNKEQTIEQTNEEEAADAAAPPASFATEKFQLFRDWKPHIPDEVWMLLESQGITNAIHDEELIKFKTHHITEGSQRTGHQWTKSFIHSLKGRIARLADESNQPNSEQDPIRDRTWADSPHPFPSTDPAFYVDGGAS